MMRGAGFVLSLHRGPEQSIRLGLPVLDLRSDLTGRPGIRFENENMVGGSGLISYLLYQSARFSVS